jgi:hypothetical protein
LSEPTLIDPATLAQQLLAQTLINDPVCGDVPPLEMQQHSPLWPSAARWSAIRRIAITEEGSRRLEEYMYHPATTDTGVPIHPGSDLPVAVMFAKRSNGTPCARIYSAHQLVAARAPILPVDPQLVPDRGGDDILVRYFPTLHSANLEASVALFEKHGYLQHSNGETYRGHERLRIDFTKFFQTGGIHLKYCNRTDAGPRTALEVYMPSGRPAVAVYERGPTGLIGAARLYL